MSRRTKVPSVMRDKRVSYYEMVNHPVSEIKKSHNLGTRELEAHVRRECYDAKPAEMESFYNLAYSRKSS